MTDLHHLGIRELSAALRSRKLSAREVCEAQLERIAKHDDRLRAYVSVSPEAAIAQADAADEALARGATGPLLGVPVGVKDICAARGLPTHVGSVALRDWNPGAEAGAVRALRAAGAVIVGKVKTTEAACGAHHPSVEAPRNPWHADYWSGASSSGSGVATAAGLCAGAVGSDTGGSIRFPSQCCGVVGIKGTWGRVSRAGVYPLAESLDHVGPFARSVDDAALLFGAMAGHDPDDPTTSTLPAPDFAEPVDGVLDGVRVGFDAAYCSEELPEEVAARLLEAREMLERRGAVVVDVAIPQRSETIEAWLVICGVEAARAHRGVYPERADDYGPALRALMEYGRALSAEEYAAAHVERLRLRREFATLFETIDCFLSPATPDRTPSLEVARVQMRGEGMRRLIRFTAPGNLSGVPTLSLPAGLDPHGVPTGFQLVGKPFGEALLCRVARAIEVDGAWGPGLAPDP